MITIINTFPPNIDTIRKHLGNIDTYEPVFAYEGKIYNPFNRELSQDVIEHEKVHFNQQGNDVEGWYTKYLTDPFFRLAQEIEAYGEQYKFVLTHVKHPVLREHVLKLCSEGLSSELYGNLLSLKEARKRIKEYSQ